MIEQFKNYVKDHITFVCLTASVAIVAVQLIVPFVFDVVFGAIQIGLVWTAARYGK